jgi:CRP/FNR family cyclic AMP-dependent transcriptional regulator
VSVRRGGVEVATLGPGAVVGEAAIVNRTLRSATVVALTPLRVVHFTREAIEDLAAEIPAFGKALRAAAAGRLESG